jgi:hypothetical protein
MQKYWLTNGYQTLNGVVRISGPFSRVEAGAFSTSLLRSVWGWLAPALEVELYE